jgi:transcriptional regulator with XRE-family HTH domain
MKENKRIANTCNRLKEAMALVGKTQADLVRETGLSKSTLSRYLSGEFEPKQNAVAKLAFSLNVSEMWLWGYDVPMEKKKTATNNDSGISEAKQQLLALAENCNEEQAERLLQMMKLFLNKQ